MSNSFEKSRNWLQPAPISHIGFSGAWLEALSQLLKRGKESAPRGIPVIELLGAQVKVYQSNANLLQHEVRNLNPRFAVAEWLWIYFGMQDLKTISRYNGALEKFSDDGITLAGAYGPRLDLQLRWMGDQLKADRSTRQAVATIWTPLPGPSKDIPCTISFQALQRDGLLHGIVNMRSSDVWLGLPYDFFTFSMLLNCLATRFPEWALGSLTFNLGSMHLYMEHYEAAADCLKYPAYDVSAPRLESAPVNVVRDVLIDPDYKPEIWDPHLKTYARVLQSKTRAEAYQILEGG